MIGFTTHSRPSNTTGACKTRSDTKLDADGTCCSSAPCEETSGFADVKRNAFADNVKKSSARANHTGVVSAKKDNNTCNETQEPGQHGRTMPQLPAEVAQMSAS